MDNFNLVSNTNVITSVFFLSTSLYLVAKNKYPLFHYKTFFLTQFMRYANGTSHYTAFNTGNLLLTHKFHQQAGV